MKFFQYCCLLLAGWYMPVFCSAQTFNQSDSIVSFETMHVHFDKDIYLPGETIWFKAYLYHVNELSLSATNFYTAIYDEKGNLIQQKQYPITYGSCNGDFQLPLSLKTNRIQFRAFTKAMLAIDTNNVYQKNIAVYTNNSDSESVIANMPVTVQLFPEGGQMIAELDNYIALKASYADGSPALLNAQVFDVQKGKAIDSFVTDNIGMAQFILSPHPKKTYKLLFKDVNGNQQQISFPTINRYGVCFHAEVVDKEVQCTVAKNRSSDSLSLLHIIAQMANYRVYKADLIIANEMEFSTFKFPIDSLPEGIMQLTLFDKDWNKLQQRILFIPGYQFKDKVLQITDSINVHPKAKSIIEINLSDTTLTELSVSVADINFYNLSNRQTITQDLLLKTQLNNVDINVDSILQLADNNKINLWLLSQPYKKYDWKKLANEKEENLIPLDNYLSVGANFKERKVIPPDDGLNLIVDYKNKKQFYNLKPIGQTTFKKDALIFFGDTKIEYQLDKNKNLVNYLTIYKTDTLVMPLTIPALKKQVRFEKIMPSITKKSVAQFSVIDTNKISDAKTFAEVVVKSTSKGNVILSRIDELEKFYAAGTMFSSKAYQLNVIDDTLGVAVNNNIQDYIKFRVPGLTLVNGILGRRKSSGRADLYKNGPVVHDTVISPLIFINDFESDNKDLQDVNMKEVAYIKYLPGIAIGNSFNTIDGVIYVYTKKGNEKAPPTKGLPFIYIKGYDNQNEFINTDYSDKSLLAQKDLRTTLYWNPNVMLDKTSNKVKIEFYNNDVSKKLLVTIEGINAVGQLIHLEKIIE